MIELGAHWQFIAAAYGGAAVLVVGLVVWALVDGRRAQARLAALEAARGRASNRGEGQ